MVLSSSRIRITSEALCTRVRKYASLLRRLTSLPSATRSTASATWEARVSKDPHNSARLCSCPATTRAPTSASPVGRSGKDRGHSRAFGRSPNWEAADSPRSSTFTTCVSRARNAGSHASAVSSVQSRRQSQTRDVVRTLWSLDSPVSVVSRTASWGFRAPKQVRRSLDRIRDLLHTDRRHQRRGRLPKAPFAAHGLQVDWDQAGKTGQYEQEENSREHSDDSPVVHRAAQGFVQEHRGSDQRGQGEHDEPPDADDRLPLGALCCQFHHGGMQRRQTPGGEEDHPAQISSGAACQFHRVGDVRRERRRRACRACRP